MTIKLKLNLLIFFCTNISPVFPKVNAVIFLWIAVKLELFPAPEVLIFGK